MNNDMKCYKVTCRDNNMNVYEVGVMTFDEFSAKRCAENSIFEGKHIKVKAVDVVETEGI